MPISPRAPEIGLPAFADSSRESCLVLLLDERGKAAEQPGAVCRGDGTPRREGGSRSGDGGVGLVDPGLLELRDRLLGGGIDDREGHAVIQHDPGAGCGAGVRGWRLTRSREPSAACEADVTV